MKINDVEKQLNIPKATIRFYEKEGLLNPKRNENSYREYDQEDIELLKKIIVLRKIGIPVDDIKLLLNNDLSLQNALTKNIHSLHEQIKEIEGALKVCEFMQNKEENINSLDENYYLDMIRNEELKGNKFFEIINDVIDFEKKVIGNEFTLIVDEEGNFKYSLGKSSLISLGMCLTVGIIWFLMDREPISFVEGFFFPFVCILISSVFGLPVFFLEKKNKDAANVIKKIGKGLCVILFIIMILLVFFIK